jgi:hypothetical protein
MSLRSIPGFDLNAPHVASRRVGRPAHASGAAEWPGGRQRSCRLCHALGGVSEWSPGRSAVLLVVSPSGEARCIGVSLNQGLNVIVVARTQPKQAACCLFIQGGIHWQARVVVGRGGVRVDHRLT